MSLRCRIYRLFRIRLLCVHPVKEDMPNVGKYKVFHVPLLWVEGDQGYTAPPSGHEKSEMSHIAIARRDEMWYTNRIADRYRKTVAVSLADNRQAAADGDRHGKGKHKVLRCSCGIR